MVDSSITNSLKSIKNNFNKQKWLTFIFQSQTPWTEHEINCQTERVNKGESGDQGKFVLYEESSGYRRDTYV